MSNVDATQQPKTLEEAIAEIDSLRSQLSGSDLKVFSQNRELRIENQKLKEEIRQLTEQCVTQTFKVRGLEKSEDKLKSQLSDSESKVQELESKVSGLESQVGDLEGKVLELGGELEEFRSKEVHLSQELETAVRTNAEALEKILAEHSQQTDAKNAEYAAALAEKEKAINELEQRVEQFKEEFLSQELTLDAIDAPATGGTGPYDLLTKKMEEFLGFPGRALVEQVFRLSGVDPSSTNPSELEETFEVLQDTASQLVRDEEQEQELSAILTGAWQELGLGGAAAAGTKVASAPEKMAAPEEEAVSETEATQEPETAPDVEEAAPAPVADEPEPTIEEAAAEESSEPEPAEVEPQPNPVAEEAAPEAAAEEQAPEPEAQEQAQQEQAQQEEADEPAPVQANDTPEEPPSEPDAVEEPAEEPPTQESVSAPSEEEAAVESQDETTPESASEETAPAPEEAPAVDEPEAPNEEAAELQQTAEQAADPEQVEETVVAEEPSVEPEAEEAPPEPAATSEEAPEPEQPAQEAPAEEPGEVKPDFELAATHLEEGRHAEALPIFELLHNQDPSEHTHQVGRLACLAGLARFEEALEVGRSLEGKELGESQEVFQESMEAALIGLASQAESDLVKKECLLQLLLRARPEEQVGLYLDEADEIALRIPREGELSLLQASHRISQDDVTEYLIDALHSLSDRPTTFALLKTNLERYPELQPLSQFLERLLDSPRAESLEAESAVRELLGQGESVEELLDEVDPGEEAVVQVFLEHMLPRSGVECDIPSEEFEELLLDAEPAAFVGSLRQALRSVDYTVFFDEIEVLSYDGDEHFLLRSSPEPKPTLLFGAELDDVPPEELRFLVLRELFSMYRRHSQLKHISAGLDDQKRVELIRACIDIFSEFESKVPQDVLQDLEVLKGAAESGGQDPDFRKKLEAFLREVYLQTESDSFLELGDFLYNEQLNRKWLDPISDNFAAKQTGMVVASYSICRDQLTEDEFEELEESGFAWLYSEDNLEKYSELRLRLQRLWSSPLKALISEPEEA